MFLALLSRRPARLCDPPYHGIACTAENITPTIFMTLLASAFHNRVEPARHVCDQAHASGDSASFSMSRLHNI